MPPVPVMSFLPTGAWEQQGFDQEADKRRTTRAENAKRLRELADAAAAQGRQLNFDEWGRMVRDTVGDDGLLYGYAPSNDTVEAFRSNANAKATQVQEEQRAKQFSTDQAEMKQVEEAVARRLQAGDNEATIGAWLQQTYPKQAQEIVTRLPKMKGEIEMKDTLAGAQLASTFSSRAEAEKSLSSNPAISKPMREAALRALDQRESTLKQGLIDKAMTIGGQGGGSSNPEAMAAIEAYIKSVPALSAMPDALEVARSAADGAWKMKRNVAQAGLEDKQRETDIAQGWESTKFGVSVDLQQQERQRQSAKEMLAGYNAENNPGVASINKMLAKEFKASVSVKGMAARALDYLSSNFVRDPSEILKAVEEGDEKKYIEAVKSASMTATPFAARRAQAAEVSDLVTGGITDYDRAARTVLRPEIMQRGKAYAQETQPINKTVIERAFVQDAAESVMALRDALQKGERFAISATDLASNEDALVRKIAQGFASSAGVDPNLIYSKIMSSLSVPVAITARPTGKQMVDGMSRARNTLSNLSPEEGRIPINGSSSPESERDSSMEKHRQLESSLTIALQRGDWRSAEMLAAEANKLGLRLGLPSIEVRKGAASAPALAPAPAKPAAAAATSTTSISDEQILAAMKRNGAYGYKEALIGSKPGVRSGMMSQWEKASKELDERLRVLMSRPR